MSNFWQALKGELADLNSRRITISAGMSVSLIVGQLSLNLSPEIRRDQAPSWNVQMTRGNSTFMDAITIRYTDQNGGKNFSKIARSGKGLIRQWYNDASLYYQLDFHVFPLDCKEVRYIQMLNQQLTEFQVGSDTETQKVIVYNRLGADRLLASLTVTKVVSGYWTVKLRTTGIYHNPNVRLCDMHGEPIRGGALDDQGNIEYTLVERGTYSIQVFLREYYRLDELPTEQTEAM